MMNLDVVSMHRAFRIIHGTFWENGSCGVKGTLLSGKLFFLDQLLVCF